MSPNTSIKDVRDSSWPIIVTSDHLKKKGKIYIKKCVLRDREK